MIDNDIFEYVLKNINLIKRIVYLNTKGRQSFVLYDDLVQSVYIDTCSRIDRHREYIIYDTYKKIVFIKGLNQIIYSCMIDELKMIIKQQNKMDIFDVYNKNEFNPDGCITNDNFIINSHEVDTVNDIYISNMIDKIKTVLPPESFKIFQLFSKGYKLIEISKILDIPVGTVQSRMDRSRKLISDSM